MADEVKFPVEYTHIMMFARSVADDNPIYHDEEYAKNSEHGHIPVSYTHLTLPTT